MSDYCHRKVIRMKLSEEEACKIFGVDDEFKSVIKIIENMPYLVKGEICTTLEDGETNG